MRLGVRSDVQKLAAHLWIQGRRVLLTPFVSWWVLWVRDPSASTAANLQCGTFALQRLLYCDICFPHHLTSENGQWLKSYFLRSQVGSPSQGICSSVWEPLRLSHWGLSLIFHDHFSCRPITRYSWTKAVWKCISPWGHEQWGKLSSNRSRVCFTTGENILFMSRELKGNSSSRELVVTNASSPAHLTLCPDLCMCGHTMRCQTLK